MTTVDRHDFMTNRIYYHGSVVPEITILEPRSKLHNNIAKDVLYLTSSVPYALVYIWSEEKTGSKEKWVTCGIQNGIVIYEEQFPDQLKEFYQGVSGYLYVVKSSEDLPAVSNREHMFYSNVAQPVCDVIPIKDVYEALLDWENRGALQILRFRERTKEEQEELIERISVYIREQGLLHTQTEEACFFQRYFKQAWDLGRK